MAAFTSPMTWVMTVGVSSVGVSSCLVSALAAVRFEPSEAPEAAPSDAVLDSDELLAFSGSLAAPEAEGIPASSATRCAVDLTSAIVDAMRVPAVLSLDAGFTSTTPATAETSNPPTTTAVAATRKRAPGEGVCPMELDSSF